jgi:hypothetical protein
MIKKICFVLTILLLASILPAEEPSTKNSLGFQGAYYFPNTEGINESGFTPISFDVVEKPIDTDLYRTLGTGWGGAEAEVYFIHEQKFPILRGEGLMADNSLAIRFRTGLSPVTLTQDFQATLTPIAFLQFFGGLQVGTGWNLAFNGLGLNNTGIPETTSLPGAVVESWVGGTFQFDLAAVVPGEWNHIVLVATEKWRHRFFTAAEDEEPWQYMADAGDNFNGWQRLGSYFIGHQPPGGLLDTYGFLLETENYMFDVSELAPMANSTPGSNWGSDFMEIVYGPLVNLDFGGGQSLAILLQLETFRRYTAATIQLTNFRNRDYLETNTRFKRLAFVWNMDL